MKKLLVANRSEIAVRVFRSATELGFRTVAIYAHEDRFGVHRFKADESYLVGKDKGPVAAYLDIENIVTIAKEKKVDLIHPGYGFLSENAGFAKSCRDANIIFVGPSPELLENMGDKTEARAMAEEVGVPILKGTPEAIKDTRNALSLAKDIGYPIMIKAAMGGGGRGMRIVKTEDDLIPSMEEAQTEAEKAFGDPSVFLERYIGRCKHIEVQIIGDQHGNVVHLHERDCSVQRRHQKVVELAPSYGLPRKVIDDLCAAAVKIAKSINYNNAGTVEFLYDLDTHDWFFIEMNPRIQVEHTVTEQITGIDIVRTQCLIAQGESLHGKAIRMPKQNEIPRNGFSLQCRITTEDPERGFSPDYGKIVNYRSAAGLGIRLDGAMGDTGSVITPFYDSLLVKLTASSRDFPTTLQRMERALREMRIRGVKTNIPFVENVIKHPIFIRGEAITTLIDTTPELFDFTPRKDRATKILNYLSDVTINGNEQVKGRPQIKSRLPLILPKYEKSALVPDGTRTRLLKNGPDAFVKWIKSHRPLLITDTTFRDAHQSLLACRMRTFDMLKVAEAVSRLLPNLFSLEMWGGATFDTTMRFLREDPFQRLRKLREKIPNICFQMLFRGSNGVGYTSYPDNVLRGFVKHSAEAGMDIFRVFDSLNYLPNLTAPMEAIREETHSICQATICYTGDIMDPQRSKYDLAYYINLAKELEKMGAHMLAIKDMSGICHPEALQCLVKSLQQEVSLPIQFHTHDSSGIGSASVMKAAETGVDVVDLALSSMSGLTSQPNLNSIVSALRFHPRNTGLNCSALNALSIYWEAVRQEYQAFDTSPKFGSAEVYDHEMPGGQYTNLREQATALGQGEKWPQVVRYYREVNQLFGDIVKVTPSSKVVGDMAIFLLTKGIEPTELFTKVEPGTSFPISVVDMLSGGLGQPHGGFPEDIKKLVLGNQKARSGRPGSHVPEINLEDHRSSLSQKIGASINTDDLYSHLMYPQVFEDFVKFKDTYSDVSVLPTPNYFYGLKIGEEINVEIEEGKLLIIKLITISEPDLEGTRCLTFELNGRAREVRIIDQSVKTDTPKREQAEPSNALHIGAPIPGVLSSLSVEMGKAVRKGEKVAVIEAMKMQTTVYAEADGIVQRILVSVGDPVESRDLIAELQ